MMEVGRLCVKIAGRDAGMSCLIVDILKDNFRDRMEKEDWMLVIELKKLLDIK